MYKNGEFQPKMTLWIKVCNNFEARRHIEKLNFCIQVTLPMMCPKGLVCDESQCSMQDAKDPIWLYSHLWYAVNAIVPCQAMWLVGQFACYCMRQVDEDMLDLQEPIP